MTMRLSLRFYVLSIAALVAGKDIPNPQVRATGVQVAIPQSLITPAPVLHGDIFKRSVATCGFIRGNSGALIFTLGMRPTSNLQQNYPSHVRKTITASLHNNLSPASHAATTSSVSIVGLHADRTVRLIVSATPSQPTPARPYMAQFFNGMLSRVFVIK